MPVKRLSRADAAKLLRECMENGEVKQTKHFRDELARETITFADAEYVMRSGNIYQEPEQELKSGDWKYKVEGPCADHQWITIVFCFKRTDQVLLITIFSVEPLKR